jgi:ATP-binding cassette subfamily B (MDR/TAP) protein 1
LLEGFTKAKLAANYYFWLTELEPTVHETDDNRDKGPEKSCASYDFQDVQFTYPLAPDNRVLKGVSLNVSTGVVHLNANDHN